MQYKEFVRIEKIKRMLDVVAYGSLGLDVAIAVVTLVSFNIYSMDLTSIERYLEWGLTAEVIVTFILLTSLAYLYHYEKIVDNLARFSKRITRGGNDKKR